MPYDNLLVSLKAVAPEIHENIKSLIERMDREHKACLNQLAQAGKKLAEQDYQLQNQEHALKVAKESIESTEEENIHLKGLVKIWLQNSSLHQYRNQVTKGV